MRRIGPIGLLSVSDTDTEEGADEETVAGREEVASESSASDIARELGGGGK